MSFRIKARKFGFGVAPVVVAWHLCPVSDETPLATPPEHVEQHAFHPVETSRIELLTSASSSGPNLSVRVDDEHVRVGDRLFMVVRLD